MFEHVGRGGGGKDEPTHPSGLNFVAEELSYLSWRNA